MAQGAFVARRRIRRGDQPRDRRADEAPERWPVLRNVEPPTRYRVLPSFPYTLFYRPRGGSVLVLAVAHHKREPLYWTHRH